MLHMSLKLLLLFSLIKAEKKMVIAAFGKGRS